MANVMDQTLTEAIIELRKEIGGRVEGHKSSGVKFTYGKLDDIWDKIRDKANELGVLVSVSESNGRTTPIQFGNSGGFIYESDAKVKWRKGNEEIVDDVSLVARNTDPAMAKGAAWTYGIKYYMQTMFMLNLIDEDKNEAVMQKFTMPSIQSGSVKYTGPTSYLPKEESK